MRYASLRDLQAIYRHFRSHRDVFPHVRQDALKRRIEAQQCVYQDGVVITYQKYRKRTRVGDVQVPAGSIMLHQILKHEAVQWCGRQGLPAVRSPNREAFGRRSLPQCAQEEQGRLPILRAPRHEGSRHSGLEEWNYTGAGLQACQILRSPTVHDALIAAATASHALPSPPLIFLQLSLPNHNAVMPRSTRRAK